MPRRRQIVLKRSPSLVAMLLAIVLVALAVSIGPRVLAGILTTGKWDPVSFWQMAADEHWAEDEIIYLAPYSLRLNPAGIACDDERIAVRRAKALPSGNVAALSYREAAVQSALAAGIKDGCFVRAAPAAHEGTRPFEQALSANFVRAAPAAHEGTRPFEQALSANQPQEPSMMGVAATLDAMWRQYRPRLSAEAVCANYGMWADDIRQRADMGAEAKVSSLHVLFASAGEHRCLTP